MTSNYKAERKSIGDPTRKYQSKDVGEGFFSKHNPTYTKHRKNVGQFKRKKNHWSQI